MLFAGHDFMFKNDSDKFKYLLKKYAAQHAIPEIIINYQHNKFLDVFRKLGEFYLLADVSHEEKWFTLYLRQLTITKLLNASTVEAEKTYYLDQYRAGQLRLNYHAALAEDYNEEVIHIPNSPASQKKTKTQMKEDIKNRKLETLIKEGDARVASGDFKGASEAYQTAIDRGILDWNVFSKCLSAYATIQNHEEVIRLSLLMIHGISQEEKTTENNIILYLTHLYCGAAYAVNIDPINLDRAHHHYTEAEQYQGKEPLHEAQQGLTFIALKRLRYYRFEAPELTPEHKLINKEMVLQYAHEAYARLDKNSSNKTPQEAYDNLVYLSEAAYFSNQYEMSIRCLKTLIKHHPDRCFSYKHLAITYCAMGDFLKAIEGYQSLLSQTSNIKKYPPEERQFLSTIYFEMGVCMIYAEQTEDAFQAFMKSMDLGYVNKRAILALLQLKHLTPTPFIEQVKQQFKPHYAHIMQDADSLYTRSEEPFLCSFTLGMKAILHLNNEEPALAINTFQQATDYYPLTPTHQRDYDQVKNNVGEASAPSRSKKALQRASKRALKTSTAPSDELSPLLQLGLNSPKKSTPDADDVTQASLGNGKTT